MKDTVFEIKMAQHRPRKPASVEYTTDEEDTIVYDMGEEIESPKNCSTVGESKKDIAKYTYVTVAPHTTLNFSRGVISPADFLNVSTEEIKENMQAQNVCDVRRITIRRWTGAEHQAPHPDL
ncbi:hypothetical protein TNCV_4390021 [Trichonephila clavipes]|nr:hypothetical protein TNCV_4390021 [Trichonephila clavipes]